MLVKMLSISVLERGVSLVGIVICGDKIENIFCIRVILFECAINNIASQY